MAPIPILPTDTRETGKQQVGEGPERGGGGLRGSGRGRVQKPEGKSQGRGRAWKEKDGEGGRWNVPFGPVCSGGTRQGCWAGGGASL